MKERRDYQTWAVCIALLVGIAIIAVCMRGCERAEAYLGIYAPTDSIVIGIAYTDTSGTVGAQPSAFEAYMHYQGTLYDSTTRIHYIRPGWMWTKVKASNASGNYGDYQIAFLATIQGYQVSFSNCWQVDSLVSYLGSLTGAERASIADSVAYNVIGYTFDSGAYDSTLGGRLYDLDIAGAQSGWDSITQADCDTVKLAGTPIAGADVIVTLSSNTSEPLYWARTDGSGCFVVYVRTGATYKVRPIYQGTWLASWCEVSK